MNTEQKLDALTQSVELLASMQIETEKRLQLLIDSTARIVSVITDHTGRLDKLEGKRD